MTMIYPRRRGMVPSRSQRSLEVCHRLYLFVCLHAYRPSHLEDESTLTHHPCLDISTETDHIDGAVASEQKGGSDLIHITGKVDFKSIHLQSTTSSQSNSNLSPFVDIEADSELTASQLRRKYHLGE